MTAFRRLSPGQTIPELMRAELHAWLRAETQLLIGQAYFAAASFVLIAARVLLLLGLITPGYAGKTFRIACVLTDAGMATWRRRIALKVGAHRPSRGTRSL